MKRARLFALAALPILAVSGLLGGCGFQPLYATSTGVAPNLSAVEVEVPHSRTGYLIKEQLDDELAHDRGAPARYRLALAVSQVRTPLGIRSNNVANRYEIDLGVSYVLTEVATGKVVGQGGVPVQISYDSADPPYAGVAAEQDGEVRAAGQAAVLLRLELSRTFARLAAR